MPPEEDVIERDATDEHVSKEQPVEKEEKPKGKGKEPDTETVSKAELAALRRERDELRESERYWSTKAREAKPAQVEEANDDDEDPDPATETFVDDLTREGMAALVKRGAVTKKAAKEMIEKYARKIAREVVGESRQQQSTESTMETEFPELFANNPKYDPDGELFKATKAELQRLVRIDKRNIDSQTALFSAASIARTKLDAAKALTKRGKPRDEDEDDRYDYQGGNEEEDLRRLRADSQGANRGRGTREVLEDDDMIPAQTREVLEKMHITSKEFLEQKRALSNGRTRGRR